MQNIHLLSVFLFPLLAAITILFFWGWVKTQKVIGGVSVIIHLIAAFILFLKVYQSGTIVLHVGSWPAGFGISLVVDRLSAIFVLLSALMAFLSYFYAISFTRSVSQSSIFLAVYLFLLFGLTGAFVAGDLFNLYVWFEVMLVSSFVLFTIGGTRAQLEGALKYVTINVFSSALFLAGIGILYGLTGTLNMAMLGKSLPLVQNQTLVTIGSVFFLVSFGVKAALFPLFFWLPASYHTAPIGFTALVVALLTKVGIYSLIRFFSVIHPLVDTIFQPILLVIAGLTMVVGVLGAAAQTDFRKILSFHIVSQIGYMAMGLAIHTPLAIAGAIFFVIHNVMVKTNLFFISGLVSKKYGSYKLKELGGMLKAFPFLGLIFAISAFSLTGIPPLSGFWGKLVLATAGFKTGEWLPITITSISLAVSLLTLFSMTKIWNEVFWKPTPADIIKNDTKLNGLKDFLLKYPGMILSTILLTALIVAMGVLPNQIIDSCIDAANGVINQSEYIKAVLGSN